MRVHPNLSRNGLWRSIDHSAFGAFRRSPKVSLELLCGCTAVAALDEIAGLPTSATVIASFARNSCHRLARGTSHRDVVAVCHKQAGTPLPTWVALPTTVASLGHPNLVAIIATHIATHLSTLRSLSPIRDITALRTWVEATSAAWEALLDRTQRCRNALAHGGPINDRVMRSASEFAHTLAAFAIGQEVQAITSGRDLTSSHEELAKDAGEWRTRIADGTTDVAGALEVRPDRPVS
jgi:hypothetical protein